MHTRRLHSLLLTLTLSFAAANASAQDLYWNPTGSTTTQGGTGTLSTAGSTWNISNTASDSLVAWTPGSNAVFGGVPGTITSNSASLVTGNVTFKSTTYTLEGDLNLSITGNLAVQQSGSLTVTDNLTINADLALYNGVLNVTGGSFSTTTNGYIGVDESSNGRLNISAGGSASVFNNSIGTLESSYGFITVDGEGSTFTTTGNNYIGQTGYGSLTIQNGADVMSQNVILGYNSGASGYVRVTGAGSTLTVSQALWVGSDSLATGSLTVDNGGVVTAGGGANPLNLGANSTLRIGQDDSAAGTVHVSNIISNYSSSSVKFDHNEASYTFSTRMDGYLGVDHLGSGTTILTAASTYQGATTVSAGTLRVNGSLANTAVEVASGATLGGSGSIGGPTTLASGAHLAPGSTVGTLTFSNGLTLNNGAILDFQLGTLSDLIMVTGGPLTGPGTLGGITLNLSNSSGFGAGTYTLLNYTSASSTTNFGADRFTLGSTIAGYTYNLTANSGLLQLTAMTAIPEPSTYALLVGACTLAMAWVRRRRSL
jgi:T5SS/PEP-CTERM-associated repeat protein/autotransporter-associated beta strand protein